MRRPITRSICLAVLLACGPQSNSGSDWMVGTWSTHEAGAIGSFTQVTNYEIRADGTIVVYRNGVGSEFGDPDEQAWRRVGEAAIEIEVVGGPGDGKHWRITPGVDCNELVIQNDLVTNPHIHYEVKRGEVCLRAEECPPEGGECLNHTYYCDGEPEACEA